jgi:hypothetical protein
MFLKPAAFGIALLCTISPSLAEALDDSTKCAVVRDPMDPRLPGPSADQIWIFILQTFDAAYHASGGFKGKYEKAHRDWAADHALRYTLAGCRDHPDTTVRDMAIETVERLRLWIETGVRPPERESLRPINIEARIVSVEAVTKKDGTDVGWPQHDPPRGMIKVTITTPVNLSELAGYPAIHFLADASICRDGYMDDSRRLDFWSGFFDDEGFIGASGRKERAAKERYTYRLYFRLEASYPPGALDASNNPRFSYDLSKDPKDICMRLRGASVAGYRAAFNSLRISEETLREAIKALK